MSNTDARFYQSLRPGYRRDLARRRRLNAAAPDLLEAAKAVAFWFQAAYPELWENRQNVTLEAVRAAIANAEGR